MDRPVGSALRFVTIAAIGLLSLPGQSALPSPAATTEIAKDLEGRGPVIRFNVNLVQVDVVVTDRNGHHVAGLTPSEFEVFQNGKRKAITHFEYVPVARPATPATRPYAPHAQPTRDEVRRSILLYIDDVRISFLDFSLVREALLHFVDTQVNEGDICALHRTSGGPAQASEFTSDPRRLHNSIERMHWQHSPPISLDPGFLVRGLTLAIRAMAPLPGRKTIVLVNSGFYRELPVVQASRKDPFDFPDPRAPFELPPEEIWKITDRANRAGVVINTIDARGLSVSEPLADYWRDASEPGIINPTFWPKLWFRNMDALDLGKSLAFQTGGLFLHNQNDLERALTTIADDSEGYYLVGWNPGDEVFGRAFGQPKYFPIGIRVLRHGYRVRTRAGFFGTPYDLRPNAPVTVAEQMNEALFSPFARKEIDVQVSSSFQHNGVLGSYIESLVHVGKTGLTFDEAEKGCRTARLELLTMARPLVRGPHEPEIVESHMGTVEACDSTKALVSGSGFVFVLRSKVSKPGPYEVRVAVRNVARGQEAPSFARADKLIRRDGFKPLSLGSANVFVEVPDLQKDQLALSGIQLTKDSAVVTVDERPENEFLYRAAVDGDPAIRYFHPGDVLRCTLRRFGACDGCTGWMTIYRAGNVVDHEPLALTGDVIEGLYRLEASAAADHYMLQVTVSRAHNKNQKAAAVQWIDFAVEPLH